MDDPSNSRDSCHIPRICMFCNRSECESVSVSVSSSASSSLVLPQDSTFLIPIKGMVTRDGQ